MREKWIPIAGFETSYEISSYGRVKSRSRTTSARSGGQRNHLGRILYPTWNCGYLKVTLQCQGKRAVACVHILVLEHFVGPRPGHARKWHGCHNDGNPANNVVGNLRWDTAKGNAADTIQHGRSIKGERSPSAKLTEDQVRSIKRMLRDKAANRSEIARQFGVSPRTVGKIEAGESWYWINDNFVSDTLAEEETHR